MHSYALWREVAESDDAVFTTDDIAISMGKHGAMDSRPLHDRGDNPGLSESGKRMRDLAEHNIAEMKRAMEEGAKWEMRLKESPLGMTQQDFVAYYAEVIAVFAEWCTVHGVSLPQERN